MKKNKLERNNFVCLAIIDLINDSFFCDYPDELEEVEQRIIAIIEEYGEFNILAVIALNSSLDADIRGVAARMFVERVRWNKGDALKWAFISALIFSDAPLVRMGVVLGLEENMKKNIIKCFLNDKCLNVKKEANRIYNEFRKKN